MYEITASFFFIGCSYQPFRSTVKIMWKWRVEIERLHRLVCSCVLIRRKERNKKGVVWERDTVYWTALTLIYFYFPQLPSLLFSTYSLILFLHSHSSSLFRSFNSLISFYNHLAFLLILNTPVWVPLSSVFVSPNYLLFNFVFMRTDCLCKLYFYYYNNRFSYSVYTRWIQNHFLLLLFFWWIKKKKTII